MAKAITLEGCKQDGLRKVLPDRKIEAVPIYDEKRHLPPAYDTPVFSKCSGRAKAIGRGNFGLTGEESQKYKFDELFASDALLLGRITYQGFAAAWPGATGVCGERINRMINS